VGTAEFLSESSAAGKRSWQWCRGRQIETMSQINQALVTTFDVAELASVLARDLPRLGIECCYWLCTEITRATAEQR